jgi:ApbE superfamily uncharacterized protein (UPF0280 family)
MPVAPPVLQRLTGDRLHFSDGPIDVVLQAWGDPSAVERAYRAVAARFPAILPELCAELPRLRTAVGQGMPPQSPVGRRMFSACLPFAESFITPMAAVAGSVADELMAVMRGAAPLARAYVKDGGELAVFCAPGERLAIGIAGDFAGAPIPSLNGALTIDGSQGIGGIATSGAQGRSFSLGIADSVTVLAANAATADAAATMIANAVDCDDPAIKRRLAVELDPDSDLGERLVTVKVGPLPAAHRQAALAAGLAVATEFQRRGRIVSAALMLQGDVVVTPSALVKLDRRW